MNKKYIILVLSFGVLLISAKPIADKYFEITKGIEIYANVYKALNMHFVDELDPASLMKTGIDAMTSSLDPYTKYISEADIENYRLSIDGKYDGIGARVMVVDDYVTVARFYKESPAAKAGLIVGDQIVEINGQDMKGKKSKDVTRFMRGAPNSKISLKVRNIGDDKARMVEVNRGEINIPNVPYSGMINEHVGYISLTTFTKNAGNNVKNALLDLKSKNDLKGVILDLRGNGGGLLYEAVSVCNVFVNKNEEIVFTKGKLKESYRNYKTSFPVTDLNMPLVVMVNSTSASASEIVSGVMQDLDRGVLLGQRTYGKGLVQNTKEVGYNSKIKMTIAKYYIPSGRCIQSVAYKNGKKIELPDSLRAEFKTRNGRTVYDGGGVLPDLVLDKYEGHEIVNSLQRKHVIFKYVSKYFKEIENTCDSVNCDYDNFDHFKAYLKEEHFVYEGSSSKSLKNLTSKSKKEGTFEVISDQIDLIQNSLDAMQSNLIEASKKEILRIISQDLASRKFFAKGMKKQALKGDVDISEAVSILNDTNRYSLLLNSK